MRWGTSPRHGETHAHRSRCTVRVRALCIQGVQLGYINSVNAQSVTDVATIRSCAASTVVRGCNLLV